MGSSRVIEPRIMGGTMSADVEVPASLAETPVLVRPSVLPRLAAGFVAGLLLVTGVSAVALAAWDRSYDGRVLGGVHVGTVDLSGLDRPGAEAALQAAYADLAVGRLRIQASAGEMTVPFEAFDRRADVEAMADEALATGRSGTLLDRALEEARIALWGDVLAPSVTLDEAALRAAVAHAVSAFELPPREPIAEVGVDGVSVVPGRDGRTFSADAVADAALAVVARPDIPSEVTVEADTTVVSPARTDAAVDAARVAAERMIADLALTSGKRTWTIPAATVRSWIGFAYGTDGSVRPRIDASLVPAALAQVGKDLRSKPVSASFLAARDGHTVGVVAGRNGTELDVDATAAAIVLALNEIGDGATVASVPALVQSVAPDLTTEEATKQAPLMELLGSWKTWFPISDRNYYGANIWIPAKLIDGTVLMPGQTFEWWRAIGSITTAKGYGMGGYIARDHTEPTGALGGGMCSSSTTLFNAALRAGLQMGARSNHRYYINRYPLGLDATVTAGSQTMSFSNDTGHPIVIRSYRTRSGGNGWVRYEIWGVPDGRTVSLSKPLVWNLRRATTSVNYVTTLPTGVRKQTEYPADGMDVSVTRVVRNASGQMIHRETYISHYQLWNGVVEVGA